MKLLKIDDIVNKYGKSKTFWKIYLCRPEFNAFRRSNKTFEYNSLFDCEIQMLLNKRDKVYKYRPHG